MSLSKEIVEHDELKAQLTVVATERVTWEAARNIANDRAARCYIGYRDNVADLFRQLAKEFEALRAKADSRQNELMVLLGYPHAKSAAASRPGGEAQ